MRMFLASLIVMVSAVPTMAAELQPVTAATGKIKFNGLLQTWFLNDTSTPADANFRLRRTELRFSGSVLEKTRWLVMVDPSKSLRTGAVSASNDNKILQDVLVAFEPLARFELLMGQFKTLTTAEGLESSSALLLPERSVVGRTFGDRREPGFMATYALSDAEPVPMKMGVMVSNGEGTNIDDTNVKKDLSARVDVTPIPALTLGTFVLLGNFNFSEKGSVGANFRLTPGKAILKAEYVEGKELRIRRRGFVTEGGYTFCDVVQPVARYEVLKSVQGRGTFTAHEATVGVNYFILGHNAKIQTSYTKVLRNMLGSGGTLAASERGKGTLFILSFQAAI